jgi:hypothetical protein
MNRGYEVLLANSALTALRREQVVAAIPAHIAAGGSAFWIRRTSLPGS